MCGALLVPSGHVRGLTLCLSWPAVQTRWLHVHVWWWWWWLRGVNSHQSLNIDLKLLITPLYLQVKKVRKTTFPSHSSPLGLSHFVKFVPYHSDFPQFMLGWPLICTFHQINDKKMTRNSVIMWDETLWNTWVKWCPVIFAHLVPADDKASEHTSHFCNSFYLAYILG